VVPSSFPLEEIIRNRGANGRIVKWSFELGEFEIEFCPRQAIKSQILADFVSEWTEIQMPPQERPGTTSTSGEGSARLAQLKASPPATQRRGGGGDGGRGVAARLCARDVPELQSGRIHAIRP
jgi:hypothetical protein